MDSLDVFNDVCFEPEGLDSLWLARSHTADKVSVDLFRAFVELLPAFEKRICTLVVQITN
jgi:hypothetical protein